MSDAVPYVDGLYQDRTGRVWTVRDAWALSDRGSYDMEDSETVAVLVGNYAPFERLVPMTEDERTAVHDVAGQIATALRLNAIARQRWGDPTQPELTEDLTDADTWRAIAEKTGAP